MLMKQAPKEKHMKMELKICYYRKFRGLTQEQLAEKLNKNLAFIGAVETPNMECTVSLDTLFNIAEVLNAPLIDFCNLIMNENCIEILYKKGRAYKSDTRPLIHVLDNRLNVTV